VCEGKESSTMQLEMQENGMRSLVMGASSSGGMTTSSTWTSLGLSAVEEEEEEEEEEEIARLGAAAAAGVVVVDVNVPCYSRRSSSRRQSPPVQLDLLPGCCTMRSSAHSSETSTPAPSSVTNPCFSWQMLASRTNSGSAAGAFDVTSLVVSHVLQLALEASLKTFFCKSSCGVFIFFLVLR
jgi:hypothetical protein